MLKSQCGNNNKINVLREYKNCTNLPITTDEGNVGYDVAASGVCVTEECSRYLLPVYLVALGSGVLASFATLLTLEQAVLRYVLKKY